MVFFREEKLPFGIARVFFTEASEERCTAALLVDVDPVNLVRKPKGQSDSGPLVAYVNDRAYTTSSLLCTALTKSFGSALGGRSRERQELADSPLPLEVRLPEVSARGGEALVIRHVFIIHPNADAVLKRHGFGRVAHVFVIRCAFCRWSECQLAVGV